jgi:hypothetical protein
MLKFGFGAISLLVVLAALTMPAIAKPAPSDQPSIKADVERRIRILKSYQSEYFAEHGRFAASFNDMVGQQSSGGRTKLAAETKAFSYRVVPNPQFPNVTMIAAVPKQKNLPTVIALINGTQKRSNGVIDSSVGSVFCVSDTAGVHIPSWQSIGKPDAITGFDCPAKF